MDQYITVAKVGDIPEGESAAYRVGERVVAVFNVRGEYHAIDDHCPHMGASLSQGQLDGGTVTCAWHAWRFRVRDGAWCDSPNLKIDSFPVRVEGDEIQVCPTPRPRDEESGKGGSDKETGHPGSEA